MSISIKPAPTGSYQPTNPCAVCFTALGRNKESVGPPIIHTNESDSVNDNGPKHPMHRKCLLDSVSSIHKCPVCKIDIPLTAFLPKRKTLAQRITDVAIGYGILSAGHLTLTYLTGSPIAAAAIPGIISSLFAFKHLYKEYNNDIGLDGRLPREIINELAVSTLATATPVISVIAATQITTSSIKTSLITAALVSTSFYAMAKFKLLGSDPGLET